jgi:hypothetical protein
MSILQSILTGGSANLISSIGNAVDELTTTKEEKMSLENELHKAKWQYEQEMRRLEVQEEGQLLADKDSARIMGTKIQESAQATRLTKNIASYLAIGATLLAFGMLYLVVFNGSVFKDSNKEVIMYVMGVVSTLLAQVYGYYFGSSLGSKEKNEWVK